MSDNITTLSCTAMGFPEAHLVHWKTGTGSTVRGNITTISNTRQYHAMTTSSFSLDDNEVCRRQRGYACVFSNDETSNLTGEANFHCSPGKNA